MVYISSGNRRMEIPTFSLPAETTCPGATDLCKEYCYAKKAERVWPNVLPSREKNYKESKRFKQFMWNLYSWLSLKQPIYFRIHESGDFYSQEYFNTWCTIAYLFPEIKFLAYTQIYDLDLSYKPDNLILYWTIWPDSKEVPKDGLKAYVIDDGSNKIPNYKDAPTGHMCSKGHGSKLTCDKCKYCLEGKGDVIFKIH